MSNYEDKEHNRIALSIKKTSNELKKWILEGVNTTKKQLYFTDQF